ncbi:DUF2304 domain-containing protein [Cnuibacter sp. UC19_7]|uniref:DUF2304 domain-containing protein n=1 Tax=Cnuibacter sp. UC19_7 TaxID=3350166 RepID=UPI00367041FB
MSVASYVFGIVAAVLVLVAIFELLRRRRVRERHAVWWIVAGVLALVITVFPQILEAAAGVFGITVPANLAFFVSIVILFLVSVQHSGELTRLEDQTRSLAEHVAIIEYRLRAVEDRQAVQMEPEGPGEPDGRGRADGSPDHGTDGAEAR